MAEIVGRDEELAALQKFLERPRPSALLIEGEAGIGKTILCREAVRLAADRGDRVLSASPTESEKQLPFAALGDLLSGAVPEALTELPTPQRSALAAALLLEEPSEATPDRRAIAVAVLGVLRALAVASTLILAIDDLQWLDGDSQSALEYVIRRLGETPIGLLFVRRTERVDEPLPLALERAPMPVERIGLGGLSLGALGALVRETVGQSFRRPALHRIHETSGGNPLFALGLAETLARNEPATPADLSLPASLREVVEERIDALPRTTVEALLVAAALSSPTRDTLERAVGERLDEVIAPAAAAGVIEVRNGQVAFTHPLLRSAVYGIASPAERRQVHNRLASLDLPLEERARHLALSADRPDAGAAALLEDAARSAAARGAPEAAAELAAHAVSFSEPVDDAALRRRRYLAASEFWGAGDVDRARAELETIVATAPPGPVRARALAQLAKNPRDMLESERLCEQALEEVGDDLALRCDILLFYAKIEFVTKGVERGRAVVDEAVVTASAIGDEPKQAHGEALKAYLDWVSGNRFDRAALDRGAELDDAVPGIRLSLEERALYMRAIILTRICDVDEARRSWLALHELALDTGDESAQTDVLDGLGRVEFLAGNWSKAAEYVDAGTELARQTGLDHVLATNLANRAEHEEAQGRLDEARADAEHAAAISAQTHERFIDGRARNVLARVAMWAGEHSAAAALTDQALAIADEMGSPAYADRFLATGVDVAFGLNDIDRAELLTCRLEQLASTTELDHVRALADRYRGLLLAARGDLDEAVQVLERAVETAGRVPVPFERARNLLALGGTQRRARRRRAARETLTRALEIFETLGALLWAERTREEIARIGGRTSSAEELTPTEQRVAVLVADGKTNKEVAAELVVTVRAVEANLSRIYSKLGIRSRAELAARYRLGDQA